MVVQEATEAKIIVGFLMILCCIYCRDDMVGKGKESVSARDYLIIQPVRSQQNMVFAVVSFFLTTEPCAVFLFL